MSLSISTNSLIGYRFWTFVIPVCGSTCLKEITCDDMRNFSPLVEPDFILDSDPFLCVDCPCPAGSQKGAFLFIVSHNSPLNIYVTRQTNCGILNFASSFPRSVKVVCTTGGNIRSERSLLREPVKNVNAFRMKMAVSQPDAIPNVTSCPTTVKTLVKA